ncbi:MAG: hypothetical protein ABIU63_09730 [Chitinophagaceae bacterium]
MNSRVLFSASLQIFLKQEGYTHIQLLGREKKPELDAELVRADYIMVPRTADFARFEDAQITVLEIDSPEITDFLDINPRIRFWVDMPAETANLYTSLYGARQ